MITHNFNKTQKLHRNKLFTVNLMLYITQSSKTAKLK